MSMNAFSNIVSDTCPHCGREGTFLNPVEKQYTRGEYRGISCKECVAAGKQDVFVTETGKSDIVDKLRAVLAMTGSPNENEASAAMAHLQRLLDAHNLTTADLEQRGNKRKPGIKQGKFDLGKAAFKWKLNLASIIADHYYCVPMVDERLKTVEFIGRPENVESLFMLYEWVMNQIKQISAEERKKHHAETGEHIDPLRWQVNFGLGVVSRLYWRLEEMAQARSSAVTSLVLSHKSEVSDYMEEKFGYRVDGQETKARKKQREAYEEREAELRKLREVDIEAYYKQRPWEHPDAIAAAKVRDEAYRKKEEKNRRKREANRKEGMTRSERRVDRVKENQGMDAREAGRNRAADINLTPHLKGRTTKGDE